MSLQSNLMSTGTTWFWGSLVTPSNRRVSSPIPALFKVSVLSTNFELQASRLESAWRSGSAKPTISVIFKKSDHALKRLWLFISTAQPALFLDAMSDITPTVTSLSLWLITSTVPPSHMHLL